MEERFPTNYSVLLSGPPGVGKFEYVLSRIREDLRLGEQVVFVTLDLHPTEIRARAKALRRPVDWGACAGRSIRGVSPPRTTGKPGSTACSLPGTTVWHGRQIE